jgi:hypothetical protein
MAQYYYGEIIYPFSTDADYYLFNLVTLQRLIGDENWWGASARFGEETPQIIVSFDGVDYLWLHAAEPGPEDREVIIRRGWVGFIGLAWGVTLALAALMVWAYRRIQKEDAHFSEDE